MNTFRRLAILSCILYGCIANGQTVDEIISKHIDAIGGSAVIDKITSQVTNYDMAIMGNKTKSVATMLTGKGFKSVAQYEGQEIIQCVTASGGWSVNPFTGNDDPTPLPDDQVKAAQIALQPGGELYSYKQKGCKVELIGREKEQGVDAYKIKWTSGDGKWVSNFFIHPTSYYIIKRESITKVDGREMTSTSMYKGYTKTDIGLVLPFTTNTNAQGVEMIASIIKVEFNKEIDPKIFEMPN